jgi:hypothetical protein
MVLALVDNATAKGFWDFAAGDVAVIDRIHKIIEIDRIYL